MKTGRLLIFGLFLISCTLSGCSLHRSHLQVALPVTDVELIDTPFFPQQQYQCGPASLAMVLADSGLFVIPDMLAPEIFIPERKGTLQLELVGAIRRYNRIPYQIKPDIESIIGELNAGRPVLVMQNLRLKTWPAYHYAVVVGVQADGNIILRSGESERLVVSLGKFQSSWDKAGNWGIVVLGEDDIPADHDIQRYLNVIADIEAAGNPALAEQGYIAILLRHPYQETAIFGLANTLYAQERYTPAATFFAYLLRKDPTRAEVANNLAESLAGLHCYTQAIELLDAFL